MSVLLILILSRVFRFLIDVFMWFDLIILSSSSLLFGIVLLIRRRLKGFELQLLFWYVLPYVGLFLLSYLYSSENFGQSFVSSVVTESRLFFPLWIFSVLAFGYVKMFSFTAMYWASFVVLVSYSALYFSSYLFPDLINSDQFYSYDVFRQEYRVKLNLSLPVLMAASVLPDIIKHRHAAFLVIATMFCVLFLQEGRLHSVALFIPLCFLFFSRFLNIFYGRIRKDIFLWVGGTALSLFLIFYYSNTWYYLQDTLFSASDVSALETAISSRSVQFFNAVALLEGLPTSSLGKLSSADGGFENLIGYFHFEDLGILGVYFIYGPVGLFLYLLPLVFLSHKFFVNASLSQRLVILSYSVLYLFTGEPMLYPGIYFLVFAYLICGVSKGVFPSLRLGKA